MFQFIRIAQVMPFIRGRLLDIGCGNNKLVGLYGNGIGKEKNDPMPRDESFFPIQFDTISFIASLNYLSIEDNTWYMDNLKNYLKEDGQIIVTCRRIFRSFSKKYIETVFKMRGYHLTFYRRFFPFNALYIFKRHI